MQAVQARLLPAPRQAVRAQQPPKNGRARRDQGCHQNERMTYSAGHFCVQLSFHEMTGQLVRDRDRVLQCYKPLVTRTGEVRSFAGHPIPHPEWLLGHGDRRELDSSRAQLRLKKSPRCTSSTNSSGCRPNRRDADSNILRVGLTVLPLLMLHSQQVAAC